MTNNKDAKTSPRTEIQSIDMRPSVGIDVEYYQGIIDDPGVPESRKRELIEIIGAIVLQFIDLGFGVHPVQLGRKLIKRLGDLLPP